MSEVAKKVPARVLVSCVMDSELAAPELNLALRTLADHTVSRLASAGLEAGMVDAAHSSRDPADLISEYDGLVVLGGSDVHPGNYGDDTLHPCSYGINPRADDFEIRLVRAAMKRSMPFLGICRGMQILNVALGGSLLQDVGTQSIHNVSANNTQFITHSVRILPDSKLGLIYRTDQITVHSAHHQAVHDLGENLIVSAVAPDGITEAIEIAGDHWGVGVQWHPEYPGADQAQLELLFFALERECSKYRSRISG
ncbi:hypothetical protein CFB41_34245 [Burkholderia sp. AU33803]|nr:hypothetical protein CFB41_34245 [Burkholderia sp. AU33803]PRD97171.1 gamma-glutamyl-gamma-aminobutyrate hydrolase family protein [Burkholderia contaminans]